MCHCCGILRARLRGDTPRRIIRAGGKRGNSRGPKRVWFTYPYPDPVARVCLAYMAAHRLSRAYPVGYNRQGVVLLNIDGVIKPVYSSSIVEMFK